MLGSSPTYRHWAGSNHRCYQDPVHSGNGAARLPFPAASRSVPSQSTLSLSFFFPCPPMSGNRSHCAERPGLFRNQFQRCRIDAISQACRLRPIGEHMAEVGITAGTADFDTQHTVAAVFAAGNPLFGRRVPITGPARAGIELGFGTEQRRITADTMIDAGCLCIPVLARERRFSAMLAADGILFIIQQFSQLFPAEYLFTVCHLVHPVDTD